MGILLGVASENHMTDAIRSRDDLLQAVRSGFRPRYLFFWGHRPLPNDRIGNPCFSQWWAAEFSVDDVRYPTAEHFMMAEKARLFHDEEVRTQILQTRTPKAAKELGRQVRNFDEEVWADARFRLVVEGNVAKFSQNRELGDYLLGTRDRVLVEASPSDRIWGIGLAADSVEALNPELWRGLNLLGFALMEARQRLRESRLSTEPLADSSKDR
jgi:ribA/ribD-fused uncharacterized protein